MKSLTCSEVGKTWPSIKGLDVEALKSVNLEVYNGEFVVVLGPSGCGKSTLLEMMSGLESVSSGKILADGIPISGPSSHRCLVYQEHTLFPWLSVSDNISFSLKMKHLPSSERRDRVREVLERVGLSTFARHFPHQLSGGMKQRTAIARALVNDPDVLLMDEPFAALDFQTRVLMQRFLLEIWETFGKTILFVTHHIDEAILLSNRVYLMSSRPGRIIDSIPIELPRPRSYIWPEFNEYRVRLTSALEQEVMKTYEQQKIESSR